MAFLVKVSGHRLESSQTRVFVRFSTLIFAFYKMLFMNRLVFWFHGFFFVGTMKTRIEQGFLKNPPVDGTVNSMKQRTRVFCHKMMSKNSISVHRHVYYGTQS
jgi:hypothetical protein